MHGDSRSPVKFEKPPIVEVACSVSFSLPKPLKTAHIGSFWALVRKDFPLTDDVAPLPTILENTEPLPQTIGIEFLDLPPLRRTWLTAQDGKHLIQLQEDRFVFNWKRVSEGEEYPSYEKVIAGFNLQLGRFIDFVKSAGLGDLAFTQLELVYTNLVKPTNGMNESAPWLVLSDHIPKQDSTRFLPAPESFNWGTTYKLPDAAGRLHVLAQVARHVKTGERVVRLDITARGLPKDTSAVGRSQWFDLAHHWITQGFADVTSQDVQKQVWERTA